MKKDLTDCIKHYTLLKIFILLLLSLLFLQCTSNSKCNHSDVHYTKYPYTESSSEGSVTYLNDSIVVIRTHAKGLDNYIHKVVNLKTVK